MITRRYDLAGLLLEVSADAPNLLGSLLSLIGEWEVPVSDDRPQCRFSLSRGPVAAALPPDGVFFAGAIGEDGPYEFAGDTTLWQILKPNELLARFDGIGGSVEFTLGATCTGETLSIVTSFALDHILSVAGHVMIHAACVELPGGKGRLVLHAPSGTGKTTTALSLVEKGYRLCTDDATILTPAGSGPVAVRGVPRPIKVHRRTAQLLPWLDSMVNADGWDENGEQWVSRKDLAQAGRLAGSEPMPVAAVVALRRSDRPMRVTTLSGAEALTEMMADNINLGSAGLFPWHDKRLDVYSQTLASCARFRLEINGPPGEVAAEIDAALQG
ncbi:hypothetical protein [Hoeflea sp.]|uniref:hypothetical protein n=1 Tax=Hoeflea sp. TaxID=1940281 RepID=UPI003B0203F7